MEELIFFLFLRFEIGIRILITDANFKPQK